MPDQSAAHPAALPWRGSAWPGLFSNAYSGRDRGVSPFPQYGTGRPEWKAGLLRNCAITTLSLTRGWCCGSISKTAYHLLDVLDLRRRGEAMADETAPVLEFG